MLLQQWNNARQREGTAQEMQADRERETLRCLSSKTKEYKDLLKTYGITDELNGLYTPEMQLGQVTAEVAEACNTVKMAVGLCLTEQHIDIVVKMLSRNFEKHIMSMPTFEQDRAACCSVECAGLF